MKTLSAQARWLRWRGLPLLVLLLGLGLTLLYREYESERDARHLRAAFDSAMREATMRIEQRMAAQEHLLQGLQGFLDAYPQADERALRLYVDALPMGADFAGVQGLGMAPLVRHADSAAFVRQCRALGASDFRIWPEGERSHYAPIVQLEPNVGRNPQAHGHDLLADPVQRRALESARDSGRMALSGRLDAQSAPPGRAVDFLMVAPLYTGGSATTSLAERRERLRGWVVATMQVQDLMASLYGELAPGLELSVHDGQEQSHAQLLYRSAADSKQQPVLSGREFLVMGGHTWTVSLQAMPAFAIARGANGAAAVPMMGAILSVLLALLAWLLGSARARAQTLAEQMTRALRESEQRWAFALEGAGDGVWDWQTASGHISSSARWKEIMGVSPSQGELSMAQMRALIHPEDLPRVHAEFQRCLEGQSQSLISEYRVGNGHGGWNWVLARATVVERNEREEPVRVIGTLSDINARRLSEERVRFMALHDPLTELANRAQFDERMHFALANARRYNESLGLILLDLDRFKPINDRYGHRVGDQLLQTVARRIKSAVRETDTVGRIGGDEFVVLLTGPVTHATAQVVADKIFNQVALPVEVGGLLLEVTCSLGLALYPDDGLDELTLTKAADDAMYRHKRTGRTAVGDARAPSPPRV